MSPALATTISAVIVGVLGVLGTIVVQRMSGRITSVNSNIDQFQEAAERADRRATSAEQRTDSQQVQIDRMWEQIQQLQERTTDQEQQLSWARGHIVHLESRVPNPPGAPPRPAGLRWPPYPTSAPSANDDPKTGA